MKPTDFKNQKPRLIIEDFLSGKGIDIYKLKGDEHVKYAKMYRDAKAQADQDATAHKGSEDHKTYTPSSANSPAKVEDETNEGGMSDIHIGNPASSVDKVVGTWRWDRNKTTLPNDCYRYDHKHNAVL